MSLVILFHFLCAQHVSDINTSIIRSLRLCCWITTSVVLFSVRCVLEIWCGWFWVLVVLRAEAQVVPNMFRTLIYQSSGTCDCVVELPHRSSCSQFVVCWRFGAAGFEYCLCCKLKLATQPAPSSVTTGASVTGDKAPGKWRWPPPSIAKAKHKWSHKSNPHTRLSGMHNNDLTLLMQTTEMLRRVLWCT